jgi:hypothetical protein
MDLLHEAREGNRVFKITFPSGEVIPFRLLSWDDFNKYEGLSQKGTIPADIVEDSIFRQCCLDPVRIDESYEMRAGIVSTVVGLIMHMSGPGDIDGFNNDMNIAREMVDTLNSQVIMVICRAFPAYKPEEIGEMSWSDVLVRLAQAERILMKKNPPELMEPISILSKEEQELASHKQSGQIDVGQLIKDGRKDAAEMGRHPGQDGLTEADSEIGRATIMRHKRREMARRLGT